MADCGTVRGRHRLTADKGLRPARNEQNLYFCVINGTGRASRVRRFHNGVDIFDGIVH